MSKLPDPIVISDILLNSPAGGLWGTDGYIFDLGQYPNGYVLTFKGFIKLETLYQNFISGVSLSFNLQGFPPDIDGLWVTDSPYPAWFHYLPQKDKLKSLISYSWNDNGQKFLKLPNKDCLLQAVTTKCKKGFVGVIGFQEENQDYQVALFARLGNTSQTLFIPSWHSLTYILKVEKDKGGLIIQSLEDPEKWIKDATCAENIPVDYWFWDLSNGHLSFIGTSPMNNIQSYPDFYYYWRAFKNKWKHEFELNIQSSYPFEYKARLSHVYKDMNIIQVKISASDFVSCEFLTLVTHNSKESEYLDKIGKTVYNNIPQSFINNYLKHAGK